VYGISFRDVKRKSANKKKRKVVVRRIPPTQPAARDEGPRLISLDAVTHEPKPTQDYYLTLADKLLKNPKVD